MCVFMYICIYIYIQMHVHAQAKHLPEEREGEALFLKGEGMGLLRAGCCYRSILLIRKRTPLGPYRKPMSRIPGGCCGGHFLMGDVPL